MIKKVLLSSGALAATLALTGSVALAASINNTGKGSVNIVSNGNTISLCNNTNNNMSDVNTFTGQQALSGNATVKHNTMGGTAKTGAATNTSTTGVGLAVTNTSNCGTQLPSGNNGGTASINNTGAHSLNVIGSVSFSSVNVVNNNYTEVNTATLQGAQSGDALVADNTGGGNATSGGSTNTSTTTVSLVVTNK